MKLITIAIISILAFACGKPDSNFEYARQQAEKSGDGTAKAPIPGLKSVSFAGQLPLSYTAEDGKTTSQTLTATQVDGQTASIEYVELQKYDDPVMADMFGTKKDTISGTLDLIYGTYTDGNQITVEGEVETEKEIDDLNVPFYFDFGSVVKLKNETSGTAETLDLNGTSYSCKKYTKEIGDPKHKYDIWICDGVPLTGVAKAVVDDDMVFTLQQ